MSSQVKLSILAPAASSSASDLRALIPGSGVPIAPPCSQTQTETFIINDFMEFIGSLCRNGYSAWLDKRGLWADLGQRMGCGFGETDLAIGRVLVEVKSE